VRRILNEAARRILGFVLILSASVGGTAAEPPSDLTAEEAHAWRLYDQYVGVIGRLDPLEGRRRELARDMKQDAQAGVSGGAHLVTSGYGHEMAVLNERVKALAKQAAELESVWEKTFAARFGPLQAAREPFVDPVTKKATGLDKVEYRLRNFAFNPATPRPPTGATPAVVAGQWQLIDAAPAISPPAKGYAGSAEAVAGKISVRTGPSDPKWAHLVFAGVISWTFNHGNPTSLRPGEMLSGLVTFTNTGREFVPSGYNPVGSLRFQRSAGGGRINFFEMKSTELPAPGSSVSRPFAVKVPEPGRDTTSELQLVALAYAGRPAEFIYRYRWVPK